VKSRIKTVFAGGVLALALFGGAAAGPAEEGSTAYERGDYAAAMSYWRPLANQGDEAAQFAIGNMYELGRGVPQDYAQALAWYRKAADQGNAAAQWQLGYMYYRGQGVPQDYAQAVAWYRKTADQGNVAAQDALGSMYHEGRGVPRDDAQAAGWWHKAADQGDALAQDALGSMYPDAIEFMLRNTESRHAEIILVLCFIAPLIFVLVLIALSRGRRLRKRVDELTHSVRGLINEQEPRYTRVLLGRATSRLMGPILPERSVRGLINEQEPRYTRVLLGRAKDKDPG
jgi:Sel1 repeat